MQVVQDLLRNLEHNLAYARQGWIFAYTLTATGLLVYRSTLVLPVSQMFRPAAEIIERGSYKMVDMQVVIDETMMFGEGVLSVYKRDI